MTRTGKDEGIPEEHVRERRKDTAWDKSWNEYGPMRTRRGPVFFGPPRLRLETHPDQEPRPDVAAVALILYPREDGLGTLLTVRRPDLQRHAGQVALPGGAYEPEDGTLAATARRETWEEVHVAFGEDAILGWLPSHFVVVSRFHICPAVVWLPEVPDVLPSDREVAAVLFPHVGRLLATRTWEERDGAIHPVYTWEGHRVWGATARVLRSFEERLVA